MSDARHHALITGHDMRHRTPKERAELGKAARSPAIMAMDLADTPRSAVRAQSWAAVSASACVHCSAGFAMGAFLPRSQDPVLEEQSKLRADADRKVSVGTAVTLQARVRARFLLTPRR